MKNSIKLVMVLNAVKNLKVSAKSGGKGSFRIKGLNFNSKEHQIILSKVDDKVLESVRREAVDVKIDAIELAWDFPMGWGKFEDGQMEFSSEENASMSVSVQGIKVVGKNGGFELEEIHLEGVQQIQEFFLALPLEDMANLASFK